MKKEKVIEIIIRDIDEETAACEIIPHTKDKDKIIIAFASILEYMRSSESMMKLNDEAFKMLAQNKN